MQKKHRDKQSMSKLIYKENFKYTELTEKIINACLEVHSALGPGFQEIIYRNALVIALRKRGLKVEVEKEFKIVFLGQVVGTYRIDLIVENKVIVELKAIVGEIPTIFKAQVISYMKATGVEVVLLINFGNESLRDNIKRLSRYEDHIHFKRGRREIGSEHGVRQSKTETPFNFI